MIILKNRREIASMQTVADGRFAFSQLKAGKYDIPVQANGFLSDSVQNDKGCGDVARALAVLR